MFSISFITSYLTFYLKGLIGIDGDFIKIQTPNTILKLIPLGKNSRTIPIPQVSEVGTDFSLDFKAFIIGLLVTFGGYSMLTSKGGSVPAGIIIILIGALMAISAFQTLLVIHNTAGQSIIIPFIIFEKAKAENCKDTLNNMIVSRHNDTNVRMHTDRQINSQNKNTSDIIDAINNNK